MANKRQHPTPAKNKKRAVAPKKTAKRKVRVSKKQSRLVLFIRQHRRLAVIVSFCILVAAMGFIGYRLNITSKAAWGDTPGEVYVESPDNQVSHPSGSTFTLQWYAAVPTFGSGITQMHVDLDYELQDGNSGTTYVSHSCSATCGPYNDHSPSSTPNFTLCAQYSTSDSGNRRAPIMTITLKQASDTNGEASNYYGSGLSVAWRNGPCSASDTYWTGSVISYGSGWMMGQCGDDGYHCSGTGTGGGGSGPAPGGGGGTGGGTGSTGDGTGPSGTGGSGGTTDNGNGGKGGNGKTTGVGKRSGTGGGSAPSQGSGKGSSNSTTKSSSSSQSTTQQQSSSGNSATRQSSGSSSTPSTGGQGDREKQAIIEPSPFYDGKQYARGSDPVNRSIAAILSDNHERAKYGKITAITLAVLVLGASVMWGVHWRKLK